MSMKKLLLLLILTFVSLTGNAQSLFDKVSESAFAAYEQNSPHLSPREQEIMKKLKAESSRAPRTITWEEFEQQAAQIAQDQARWEQKKIALANDFLQLKGGKKSMQNNIFAHQGRPDYAKETKGVKYIYVSDASGHDTQKIPVEVARLLREVRQANPEARILLASEFAVRTSRFDVPICFASQRQCSIGYPGLDNYNMFHRQVLENLHIDLLGLDDYLQDDIWPKIGDTHITYSVDNPHVQKALEVLGDLGSVYDSIRIYVSFSFWGVAKRNYQWQRYIQAVKSDYDIIVVYCGNGHLDSGADSLPLLLAEPYVQFDFFSDEETNVSIEESMTQSQLDIHLQYNGTADSTTEELSHTIDLEKQKLLQKIDTTKNYYLKSTDETDSRLFKKWQEMYRAESGQDYVPGPCFEVYLIGDENR